jgi:hypothetical protein
VARRRTASVSTVLVSAQAQGDVRYVIQRSSRSAQASRRSRDRGCKGHRILRRVPDDGRHSGSSRAVTFHEVAVTVASAVRFSLQPRVPREDEIAGCTREGA